MSKAHQNRYSPNSDQTILLMEGKTGAVKIWWYISDFLKNPVVYMLHSIFNVIELR